MSNPAVLTLAEGRVKGQHITIEDNLGESIHIHIGDITFYLTVKEFANLVESFLAAGSELCAERGISFDEIDVSALDWNWLKKYKQIASIKKKEVCIKDLYTINKTRKDGVDLWHYVGIKQSKNYKALTEDKNVLSQYNEFCLYGQDSESRLDCLFEYIKENGYPFDNKYIIVNQYGLIYDGAHRAAILAQLYGIEAKIPVTEILFKDDLSIDEYNKRAKRKWKESKRKKFAYNVLSAISYIVKRKWRIKTKTKTTKQNNESKINNGISFSEFERLVKQTEIRHFYIEKLKTDVCKHKIADIVLVVEKDKFSSFKNMMKELSVFEDSVSCYYNYNMLYSLDRPVLYRLNNVCVMACGQMFVKSLFFDSLLPVDSYVIDQTWKSVVDGDFPNASKEIILVTTIMDVVFEQGFFTDRDVELFKNNKALLSTTKVKVMLEKEFFRFTDNLVDLLINERFESIITEFLSFKEY